MSIGFEKVIPHLHLYLNDETNLAEFGQGVKAPKLFLSSRHNKISTNTGTARTLKCQHYLATDENSTDFSYHVFRFVIRLS
jgi:hypothetical protein